MNNLKSELIKTSSDQAGLLLNELNMRKDFYHYNSFFNLYNQYLANPQVTNTIHNCQMESVKHQQRTTKNNSFHINQILPELFDQETVPIKKQVNFKIYQNIILAYFNFHASFLSTSRQNPNNNLF